MPTQYADFEPAITKPSTRLLRSAAKRLIQAEREELLKPKPLPSKGQIRQRYT